MRRERVSRRTTRPVKARRPTGNKLNTPRRTTRSPEPSSLLTLIVRMIEGSAALRPILWLAVVCLAAAVLAVGVTASVVAVSKLADIGGTQATSIWVIAALTSASGVAVEAWRIRRGRSGARRVGTPSTRPAATKPPRRPATKSVGGRGEVLTGPRNAMVPIGDAAFHRPMTFRDLQRDQGTSGRVDPHTIALPDLTDDERAALLAAVDE